MTYYSTFSVVPAYEIAQWAGDRLSAQSQAVQDAHGLLWGGKDAPPAIGTKIRVTMNRLGEATVIGYFQEEGWVGLLVTLHNPPEWLVKQRKGDKGPAHVFGPEYVVEG